MVDLLVQDKVLTAVRKLIEERKQKHRYPPCITVRELANEVTELQRHKIDESLNELFNKGHILLLQAINDITIYLNDEKGRT